MPGGRRPAPTGLKVLRGDRASRVNLNEPLAGEALPEKPSWLTDSASEVWDRVVGEMDVMHTCFRADQDVILSYVLVTDAVTRLGETLVKAPGLVRDASGQPTVNPTYTRWERMMTTQVRLAAELGLTPSSRGRFNVRDVHPGAPGRPGPVSDLLSVNDR
jgi:P27 family predicted phage terminase small subunit